MSSIFYVILGGGVGSALRYGISKAALSFFPSNLPAGTLLSNILACLVLGVTLSMVTNSSQSWVKYAIIIGFCGGLSTFSTFSMETVALIKSGQVLLAGANVFVSMILCFTILWFWLK